MAAKDNPCRKFQANIFNKSKCQNCFKPRESHLLNDEDLNQVRPSPKIHCFPPKIRPGAPPPARPHTSGPRAAWVSVGSLGSRGWCRAPWVPGGPTATLRCTG